MTIAVLLTLTAYLLGSLSTAIIVCRMMNLPDPRTQGSRNPGATNVLRIAGKKIAAIVLVGDAVKGFIPALIAQSIGVEDNVLAAVGMAAFLGHLYPLYFGFHGGKGVATAFGVLLGANWPVALAVLATWLLVAKVLRISSLSAVIAACLAPFFAWFSDSPQFLVMMTAAMSMLLLWRHRSNIQRIISGAEEHIGR